MAFKKGESGNPRGRTKGTPNAITKDLRERVRDLLENQFDKIAANVEALEPKDQISAWLKMAEFVLPKLTRTETTIDLSKLTDEQVDALFARALEKANEYEKQ